MMSWWCAWAWAADVDIERIRLMLDRGAPDAARSALVDLLGTQMAVEPEAVDVYLDALAATGLGHQADSVAALVGTNPWDAALNRSLDAADDAARATFARSLAETFPTRPDLLWPLFDGAVPGPDVARERKRAVRDAIASIGPSVRRNDTVRLYRARRLLLAAGEPVQVVDAALTSLGEPAPPDATLWTAAAISEAAGQVAKATGEALPDAPPEPLLAIVRRAADLRVRARFVDGASRLWAALRQRVDSAEAATAHASVLLDQERLTEALQAANDAVRLAVLPTSIDVAAINATRRAGELVDALAMRAHVRKSLGHWDAARVDLHIATMLADEPVDTQLAEQLDRGLVPQIGLLKKSLEKRGGAPIDNLVADAKGAVAAGDRDAVERLVAAAILWSASLGARGDLLALQVGNAVVLRAQAAEQAGDPVAALVDWSTAVWLPLQGKPIEWSVRRARALEAAGLHDAAFEAWAEARASGAEVDDGVLVANWRGLGDWQAAADRPAEVVAEATTTVTPVLNWQAVTPRARTSRALDRSQADVSWQVETPQGTVSSTSLRGRVVVLTFWSADCGTCLAALPQMATAVRDLRSQGRDAVLVAVSVDDDPAIFEAAARLGERWGTLARDPELAHRVGVQTLPTTWIIDRNGAARYRTESWVGRDSFERLLERTATE